MHCSESASHLLQHSPPPNTHSASLYKLPVISPDSGSVCVDVRPGKDYVAAPLSDNAANHMLPAPTDPPSSAATARRLLDLIQERQMLGSAVQAGRAPPAGGGTVSCLHQAHQQLMSVVAARPPTEQAPGSLVGPSKSSKPSAAAPTQAVQELATQLQGQDGGADKVSSKRPRAPASRVCRAARRVWFR